MSLVDLLDEKVAVRKERTREAAARHREQMPIVAEMVDEIRAIFGNDMRVTYVHEGQCEIGTSAWPADKSAMEGKGVRKYIRPFRVPRAEKGSDSGTDAPGPDTGRSNRNSGHPGRE